VADTVKQLDEVMTEWEKAVESSDDTKLQKWHSTIAHTAAANAYYIGQIVYVCKEQGKWDPEKGVKRVDRFRLRSGGNLGYPGWSVTFTLVLGTP